MTGRFLVMTSLQDVADSAGVSRSVASRVLSGDARARISERTRQRVRKAASELDYIPDNRARALRMRRAGAIALLVPEVNNAIFSELLAGVDASAHNHGNVVVVGSVGPQRDVASIVGRGRVDGAILQRPEFMDDDSLRNVLSTETPMILFNSRLEGHQGSVILDDAQGAKIGTDHLLGLGHRRIGFIGGRELHDAARRRRRGFAQAIARAEAECRTSWILEAGWEAAEGSKAMRHMLDSTLRPTAVLVASANAAIGALAAARMLGFRVPEDLSIIGIQDTWFADFTSPPLTVVKMPMREAGSAAADMLYQHLKGESLGNIVIKGHSAVVERGSAAQVHRR